MTLIAPRMSSVRLATLAIALFAWSATEPSYAQDPGEVLAENAYAKLTRADYDAELSKVPPELRDEFASDPKRLTTMLNNMLIAKTLAAQARSSALDKDPLVSRRMSLEADKFLATV